jgi:hypothetical protein
MLPGQPSGAWIGGRQRHMGTGLTENQVVGQFVNRMAYGARNSTAGDF